MRKKIFCLSIILFLSNCFLNSNNDDKDKNRNLGILALAISRSSVATVDREAYAGGDATSFVTTTSAFKTQAPNVTDQTRKNTFAAGDVQFNVLWVPPGTAGGPPGLGPVFNSNNNAQSAACSSCHISTGRGQPNTGLNQTSLLFRLSNATNYGEQLNPSNLPGIPNEGTMTVSYAEVAGTYGDGTAYSLRQPTYTLALANFGSPAGVLVSPRIAQQTAGLGLLEAIPEETLLSYVDTNDANGDGISGRANYVTDTADGKSKIGRFGWKSNQPNLNKQNQDAFLGDMGITSALNPTENCSTTQAACLAAPTTGRPNPEVRQTDVDAINLYMLTIGAPGRRNHTDTTVQRGKSLMVSIGCTKCHIAEIRTGTLSGTTEVSNQTIRPYTDLLLHDMGTGLQDGRTDGLATGLEWRTPPLWGVGLVQTVNGHTNFLHDGRARSFEEAILWHGGEGETSKESFRKLAKTDRDALVKFLESL